MQPFKKKKAETGSFVKNTDLFLRHPEAESTKSRGPHLIKDSLVPIVKMEVHGCDTDGRKDGTREGDLFCI